MCQSMCMQVAQNSELTLVPQARAVTVAAITVIRRSLLGSGVGIMTIGKIESTQTSQVWLNRIEVRIGIVNEWL